MWQCWNHKHPLGLGFIYCLAEAASVALWPRAGSEFLRHRNMAQTDLLLRGCFVLFFPQLGRRLPSIQLMTRFGKYSPEMHFSGTLLVNVAFVYVPAFRFKQWRVFRSRAASQLFHLDLIKCVFLPKVHAHSSQLQLWQKHVCAQIYEPAEYFYFIIFYFFFFAVL